MIGTEFLQGQGFGNQLFCYVTTRCIALDNNFKFGTIGQHLFGAPRWNKLGAYFMNINLGHQAQKNNFSNIYKEKTTRRYMNNSYHDMTIGCDISLHDEKLWKIPDNTLIYGNMQSEKYFLHRKQEIKQWLRIKPEYDSFDFYKENLCIMNMRGGEYVGNQELFLNKKYWTDAMGNMKKINPNMEFIIITDDVKNANKVLPDIEAKHFSLDKDYVSIKNAKYLILSNSSFAFFPVFTSDTIEYIIAPKYWARHNVSDGYWASAQNIYTGWNYQDKDGKLYSDKQCYEEFNQYKNDKSLYTHHSKPFLFPRLLDFKRKIKKYYNNILK